MSNMSYCRFVNTYHDLRDCFENWDDDDISEAETKYRAKLLMLCQRIVNDYAEE